MQRQPYACFLGHRDDRLDEVGVVFPDLLMGVDPAMGQPLLVEHVHVHGAGNCSTAHSSRFGAPYLIRLPGEGRGVDAGCAQSCG
jgi:hypothetical protein